MPIDEIAFAIVTGLVSAGAYSAIESLYSYFRWQRTRRYFLFRIRGSMSFISSELMTILEIDPIYLTQYDIGHVVSDEEFVAAIEKTDILDEQWDKINKLITATAEFIDRTRKEALLIPTYSANDFHKVDSLVSDLWSFTQAYSWLHDEMDDPKVKGRLKKMLVVVVNASRTNLMPTNFLHRRYNRYKLNNALKGRRKRLS